MAEKTPELQLSASVGYLALVFTVRLDGGFAAEEGKLSSSLGRLPFCMGAGPRFPEDMLGRSGELENVNF